MALTYVITISYFSVFVIVSRVCNAKVRANLMGALTFLYSEFSTFSTFLSVHDVHDRVHPSGVAIDAYKIYSTAIPALLKCFRRRCRSQCPYHHWDGFSISDKNCFCSHTKC